MKQKRKTSNLMFRIEHFDIGATLMTTISIGDTPVVSYFAHTRHTDTADESAEKILATVFKDQLIASATTNGHTLIENHEDPYEDDWY